VHTEAAMLTMDQILASNELTMAATAAMPAMVSENIYLYVYILYITYMFMFLWFDLYVYMHILIYI
jgi:hypothetical protein